MLADAVLLLWKVDLVNVVLENHVLFRICVPQTLQEASLIFRQEARIRAVEVWDKRSLKRLRSYQVVVVSSLVKGLPSS